MSLIFLPCVAGPLASSGGGAAPPSFSSNTSYVDTTLAGKMYKTEYAGAPPTASTANNDPVGFVIVDGGDAVNRCMTDVVTTTVRPLLQTSFVNGNNGVTFDGSDDNWTLETRKMTAPESGFASLAGVSVATALTASAFSYVAAIRVRSTTLAATLPTYQQHTIFADTTQFVGLYAGNVDVSTFKFGAYVWDGADKKAQIVANKNQWYVVGVKLEGGNIKIRLNGGSFTSAATGNILTTTGTLGIDKISGAACALDLLGFATFNAALSDSALLSVERFYGGKIGVSF